ncbi:MAG: biotin/lipoyl-binding protein [Lachnospiraceae bacterium]|nr:biotin/lipoyl-binding protein [Lachnospiraceae bacterium]
MKKRRLLQITGVFFALMICFTILSRAAYQEGTAVVHTNKPMNMAISHEVKAAGKVVQNQKIAVTTEADLRVASVEIAEGQRVSRGDLLFTLDQNWLREKILNQQQEMEKQQLSVKDAKSQNEVSRQQKANEQAQAAENYSLSTGRANTVLARAKRNLEEAKKRLREFRENSGQSNEDSSVETALEEACQEKAEAYIQAQQELTQLQWKIENEVNIALNAAMNGTGGAGLSAAETVLTGSADVLPLEDDADGNFLIEENDPGEALFFDTPEGAGENGSGTAADSFPAETQGYIDEEPSDPSLQEDDPGLIIEDDILLEDMPDDTDSYGIDRTGTADLETEESEQGETPASPTQEELNRIEQSVRDRYKIPLENARKKVETAKEEKEAAEQALAQYQQERLSASSASNAQTEQTLIDQVKAAQDAYVDACLAANEAAVTSGRSIAAAGIPNASNSSDRMNEITYEQMELTLEKLEELERAQGKIYAPADGLVTKVCIQTGEKTGDTTAILLADLSRGSSFQGEITEEQEKYIGTGDAVTLTGPGKNEKYEDLAVSSVTAKEGSSSVYQVKVQLPADTMEIGAAATLDFVRKSEIYNVCVPLSALHLDEKNQPYVLVVDQVDSVMGTEQKARKVSVTILEKNESYAALAEGAISSQQEIIVSSDKAVDDGSRVRVSG